MEILLIVNMYETNLKNICFYWHDCFNAILLPNLQFLLTPQCTLLAHVLGYDLHIGYYPYSTVIFVVAKYYELQTLCLKFNSPFQ